jgi:hypothetical protein
MFDNPKIFTYNDMRATIPYDPNIQMQRDGENIPKDFL